MARFNTQPITGSVTSGGTLAALTQNGFIQLTGTAPYTVTLPSPVLYPGFNQTFYNATSGTVTLTTPAGNFVGAGGSGTANVTVPTTSTINLVSDGVNYVVVGEDGTSLTATTGAFSGNVTINGASATLSVTPQTVTIAPGGTSTIDNINIGATTRGSGAFNTLAANNAVTFTAGTASSTTGTGTLVVTGGVGVSGNINSGGTVAAVALSGPLTGTIQTAAQTNITSVGALTGLTIDGALSVGGLYNSPTQTLAITLGSETWVKLCTLVNRCAVKIQIGAGSGNSEEESEIEIIGTYTLAGTQINVKRQTYNEHLREVRVTQSAGGLPKIVYVRLRSNDLAPNINWRLFSSRGVTALHSTVETPSAGESLLVDQYNGYFTNAITKTTNTLYAGSISTTGALTSSASTPLSFTYNGNSGTYTQSVIYANQNNTSGNTANGIFIERGRLTDSGSGEIRSFVIGDRGGAIQLILNKDGNLLVGNSTDPLGGNRLLVQSASTVNNNRTMSVYNTAATSTTAFANRLLQLSSSGSGADVSIHFSDQVANNAYIGMGSGALYFAIGGGTTKNMTLDSSGNLGIGIAVPIAKLDVRGTVSTGGPLWLGSVGDNTAYDNVGISYTGYNGGGPEITFQPRTTPGSGVINSTFYFKNSNGTSTSSNNTANVQVDKNISTLNGYISQGNVWYAEKTFHLGYFPNAVANQVVYLNFGNSSINGNMEVTVSGSYSNQSSTGILRKVFSFGLNSGNSQWCPPTSRISESDGTILNNIVIGEMEWDSGGSQYRLPIYHIVSTGNGFYAHVRSLAGQPGYNVMSNITVSDVGIRSVSGNTSNTINFPNAIRFDNIQNSQGGGIGSSSNFQAVATIGPTSTSGGVAIYDIYLPSYFSVTDAMDLEIYVHSNPNGGGSHAYRQTRHITAHCLTSWYGSGYTPFLEWDSVNDYYSMGLDVVIYHVATNTEFASMLNSTAGANQSWFWSSAGIKLRIKASGFNAAYPGSQSLGLIVGYRS